jgi:undecaprenyl-diphosphatase
MQPSELIKTAILGVIQGLTEFLPVSSDGHLALGQRLLGTGGELEMTVLLHAGTLLATAVVFRRDLVALAGELVASLRDPSRLRRDPRGQELLAIILASIPTAVIGFTLRHAVDRWSRVLWIVGVCFLGTGVALVASRYGRERRPWSFTPWRATLIGVAQGAAVLPGLSRSACTLAVALLLGAPPGDAFRFSFILSLPAVAGALLLELAHPGALDRAGGTAGAFGAAVAFVVGIAALLALRGVISRGRLWQFAFYVVPLALVTLVMGLVAPG